MPAGVVPAWYRETILSIALREGFHRCARVAVGHPKNPKKLCLPRKSLACPVLARCLPVVASLLARLSRPRQDGLERSGGARESGKDRYGDEVGGSVGATRKMTLVAEKETTRTTDAETTETKHGTMGVKRERYSFAHSVKDAEPHTHVWIRTLRLEHLKKHSHLSDPDGGELLLKICGRQPSRRDSRARFLAALVPKYRPRARLVLLFLLPRVLPG